MNPSRASAFFFMFVFKQIGSTALEILGDLLQQAALDVYTRRKESKENDFFKPSQCGRRRYSGTGFFKPIERDAHRAF
jgi:hypothetical protein